MSRPSRTRQAASEPRLRRYVYAVVLASVPVAAGALVATSLPGRHAAAVHVHERRPLQAAELRESA